MSYRGLETLSDAYYGAINYYGLVELEYSRPTRWSIQVVGRLWTHMGLSHPWSYAGVDFPAMLFADSLGNPCCFVAANPGRWVRLVRMCRPRSSRFQRSPNWRAYPTIAEGFPR